ncbi:hypothetical protein SUNDANCE_69 [Brevibacillus phage Sundance]|nr:hypothetical protein AVT09_gp069 [Brevibacillus phage Sundance]ALA47885.1 hypothetical protein SUNDANCE_69 [Brevibacillus phage Sundance]
MKFIKEALIVIISFALLGFIFGFVSVSTLMYLISGKKG